jgi:hypothetical protein
LVILIKNILFSLVLTQYTPIPGDFRPGFFDQGRDRDEKNSGEGWLRNFNCRSFRSWGLRPRRSGIP